MTKLTSRAKRNFELSLSARAKENPKAIWQYINSKSKCRPDIGELYVDPQDPKSEKTNDDKEKADILADFFASVFTGEPLGEVPSLEDREIVTAMKDLIITEKSVKKLLKNLNINKSPGMDGLHPRLLRELADVLAEPLCVIFDRSVKMQQIPNEWKKARISAIFKKGNKSLAGNYRPVSLTSVVCKQMEKLVREHIIDHMNINNLFNVCVSHEISGCQDCR